MRNPCQAAQSVIDEAVTRGRSGIRRAVVGARQPSRPLIGIGLVLFLAQSVVASIYVVHNVGAGLAVQLGGADDPSQSVKLPPGGSLASGINLILLVHVGSVVIGSVNVAIRCLRLLVAVIGIRGPSYASQPPHTVVVSVGGGLIIGIGGRRHGAGAPVIGFMNNVPQRIGSRGQISVGWALRGHTSSIAPGIGVIKVGGITHGVGGNDNVPGIVVSI